MVEKIRHQVNRTPWRILSRWALAAGLFLALSGCNGTGATAAKATLQPTQTIATAPALTLLQDGTTQSGDPHPPEHIPLAETTQFGDSHSKHGFPAPEFYGAAPRPLEERIYKSEIIVRAQLLSSKETGSPSRAHFTFQVLEYLKGTGPDEIKVDAHAFYRNENWEAGESLLFLNSQEVQAAAGAPADGAPLLKTFVFTPAHYEHPDEYTIESLNPVWLPATGPSQAIATSEGG